MYSMGIAPQMPAILFNQKQGDVWLSAHHEIPVLKRGFF
jgi:hypothetical protein